MQFTKVSGGKCKECMQSKYDEMTLKREMLRNQRMENRSKKVTFECEKCNNTKHNSRRFLENDYCIDCEFNDNKFKCSNCLQTYDTQQFDGKLLNT